MRRESPYLRTAQMMQTIAPSWAARENETLALAAAGLGPIRLPEMTVRVEFGHVGSAAPRLAVGSHIHSQFELARVESGGITLGVEEQRFEIGTGEIFLMPAREIHHWNNHERPTVFIGLLLATEPTTKSRSTLGYRIQEAARSLGFRLAPDPELELALRSLRRAIQERPSDALPVASAYLQLTIALAFRALRAALKDAEPTEEAPAERYLLAAQAFIHAHLSEPLSNSHIAAHVGISERHLNRLFRGAGFQSVHRYMESSRIDHAKWLLQRQAHPIKTVAQLCGFDDPAYFSRIFKERTSQTPQMFARTR